ncbi:hypothetical protein F5884DRAFT_228449 [Xylogone sp. PMI_703]|nr:hypothetical protein F5884DRAFT_228449 [Xylogone sp. PMI_703]
MNTFNTPDDHMIRYLPWILLPQRFNSIRSLHLKWTIFFGPPLPSSRTIPTRPETSHSMTQYIQRTMDRENDRYNNWVEVWNTLAVMQNLEDLHVALLLPVFEGESWARETALKLTIPIKQVTRPKHFILSLPLARLEETEGIDPWEELPCTVVRKHGYLR